jgi:hypothetical protein
MNLILVILEVSTTLSLVVSFGGMWPTVIYVDNELWYATLIEKYKLRVLDNKSAVK